jgi:hypothetical protein
MRSSVRWVAGVVAALVLFGATTGVALAGDGYGGIAGQQTGGSSGSGGSGLPFTGLELLWYAVVAAFIVAAGLALRVIAGRQSRL